MGTRRPLFAFPAVRLRGVPSQPTPDGGFIIIRRSGTNPLILVQNFQRGIEAVDAR
jgi:hypothetical protein